MYSQSRASTAWAVPDNDDSAKLTWYLDHQAPWAAMSGFESPTSQISSPIWSGNLRGSSGLQSGDAGISEVRHERLVDVLRAHAQFLQDPEGYMRDVLPLRCGL